jgi:hypothetical protein
MDLGVSQQAAGAHLQVRLELGQEILIEEIKALGGVLGTCPGGYQLLMTPVIPQRFELLSEVVYNRLPGRR